EIKTGMEGKGEEKQSELGIQARKPVAESCSHVAGGLESSGLVALSKFFTTEPPGKPYLRYFSHLEGPLEQERSWRLNKEAHRVLHAIRTVLQNLNPSATMSTRTSSHGQSHSNEDPVQPRHYKIFNGMVLHVLSLDLHEDSPGRSQEAWNGTRGRTHAHCTGSYFFPTWVKTGPSSSNTPPPTIGTSGP
uniref:superoxide dismutase n=1 Tax=Bos mutus grunniens TaxID=30521 RepID=A0A8B9YQM4_BOSMU